MGTCNGALSTCSLGGYAFETRCHLGKSAVWDTINELGWSSNLMNHEIRTVAEHLLEKDGEWYTKKREGDAGDKHEYPVRTLPEPVSEEEDCFVSPGSWLRLLI